MRNCPEQFDFPPIFIVGVGRSGTTLVQSMLNAHPQVCFPPEVHFLRRYVASGKADALYAGGGFAALLADLESDEMVQRLAVDIDRVLQGVVAEAQPFQSICLYTALLKAYALADRVHIGDKDPRSIEFLPTIYHFFPDAYVIHVIRDPRDNIVSRMNAAWSGGRSFYRHLFVYNAQLRMGRRWGRELFAGRYVELVYEQLISRPEETLWHICRALAIDF
ncbi:MAG TPA: sulfotransferase, partial [Anaerolineae bacterium]|nr:sulfotransferase [Anaerolineae bacterium]